MSEWIAVKDQEPPLDDFLETVDMRVNFPEFSLDHARFSQSSLHFARVAGFDFTHYRTITLPAPPTAEGEQGK